MAAAAAPAGYSVLVLGATGATGKQVVLDMLNAPRCARVTTLGRRPVVGEDGVELEHPKLRQRVVDLEATRDHPELFQNFDAAVCCIGTTRAQAGSAENFIRIDHDLVITVADVAQRAGIRYFAYVSSLGANANSWFLYPRSKGETERDLTLLRFPHLSIFRPSLLLAEREDSRVVEWLSQKTVPYIGAALFWGPLRKYRAIRVETVARGIRADLEEHLPGLLAEEQEGGEPQVRIIDSDTIESMGSAGLEADQADEGGAASK